MILRSRRIYYGNEHYETALQKNASHFHLVKSNTKKARGMAMDESLKRQRKQSSKLGIWFTSKIAIGERIGRTLEAILCGC